MCKLSLHVLLSSNLLFRLWIIILSRVLQSTSHVFNIAIYYNSKSLELDLRDNLVLDNIRELDRDLSTNYSILYTTNHGLCSLLCNLL